MANQRDYRNEARAARMAARQSLLALREARRKSANRSASKPAMAESSDKNEPVLTPGSLFQIPTEPDEFVAEQGGRTSSNSAGNVDAEFDDVPDPDVAEVGSEPEARAAVAESVVEETDIEEPSECVDGSAEDAPVDASADPAPGNHAETGGEQQSPENSDTGERSLSADVASIDPDSDLFRLPGAGAGMIWMFNQCGIHSMADLANADRAELAQNLGVVGRILNIEPWMAFARDASQAEV